MGYHEEDRSIARRPSGERARGRRLWRQTRTSCDCFDGNAAVASFDRHRCRDHKGGWSRALHTSFSLRNNLRSEREGRDSAATMPGGRCPRGSVAATAGLRHGCGQGRHRQGGAADRLLDSARDDYVSHAPTSMSGPNREYLMGADGSSMPNLHPACTAAPGRACTYPARAGAREAARHLAPAGAPGGARRRLGPYSPTVRVPCCKALAQGAGAGVQAAPRRAQLG